MQWSVIKSESLRQSEIRGEKNSYLLPPAG